MKAFFFMAIAAMVYFLSIGLVNVSIESNQPAFQLIQNNGKDNSIQVNSAGKIMYSNQLTGYISGKQFQNTHMQEIARFTSFGDLLNSHNDQLMAISEDGFRASDYQAEYKWHGDQLYKNGKFTGYQLISAKNEAAKPYAIATYYLIQQQQLRPTIVHAKAP